MKADLTLGQTLTPEASAAASAVGAHFDVFFTVFQLVGAVVAGDTDRLKTCIESKAVDVNALAPKSRFYRRPALVALVKECAAADDTKCALARLLIDAKAKPDGPDTFFGEAGDCALHRPECSPALMEILLSANPNVETKNKAGNTPLHCHAEQGNAVRCKLLLTAKADANGTNNDGNTPLLLAALGNHAGVIPVLLASGADIEVKNNKGESAETLSLSPACREALLKHDRKQGSARSASIPKRQRMLFPVFELVAQPLLSAKTALIILRPERPAEKPKRSIILRAGSCVATVWFAIQWPPLICFNERPNLVTEKRSFTLVSACCTDAVLPLMLLVPCYGLKRQRNEGTTAR